MEIEQLFRKALLMFHLADLADEQIDTFLP